MNMKRNKKFEKEKALIRVKDEINENWQAIRNQAWIELDKPIAHGWNGEWVLRDDIARSPEADVLNYIIEKWGRRCWSRRKDFRAKEWKKKTWYDIKPNFKGIDESTYLELHRTIQKYFTIDYKRSSAWRTYYRVYIDPWKLVMKTSRSYITHYKEHDEILQQIEAELDSELYRITPYPWGKYSAPKWWRRSERRKLKTKNKAEDVEIVKAYNSGCDLDDYGSSPEKTDSWHYW